MTVDEIRPRDLSRVVKICRELIDAHERRHEGLEWLTINERHAIGALAAWFERFRAAA